MIIMLSGIVTLVRLEQSRNAEKSMLEPPVITTVLSDEGTYELLLKYDDAPNM